MESTCAYEPKCTQFHLPVLVTSPARRRRAPLPWRGRKSRELKGAVIVTPASMSTPASGDMSAPATRLRQSRPVHIVPHALSWEALSPRSKFPLVCAFPRRPTYRLWRDACPQILDQSTHVAFSENKSRQRSPISREWSQAAACATE